jgi:hypothetical protein
MPRGKNDSNPSEEIDLTDLQSLYRPFVKLAEDMVLPEADDYDSEWMAILREEHRRCKQGWLAPDGRYINPIAYFYWNHVKIDYEDPERGPVVDNPPYTKKEHELLDKVYFNEYVSGSGVDATDLIAMKARRKRWTYTTHCAIFLWDFCLGDNNTHYAIGYDSEKTQEEGQRLFVETYERLSPFWKADALSPNKSGKIGYGQEVLDPQTGEIKYSVKRTIVFRCIDKVPASFKGMKLKRCLMDEAGKYTNLKKAIGATTRCFYVGTIKTGQLLIGGTADSITNKSSDYIDLCKSAEKIGLIKHFISAAELAYPYINAKTGDSLIEPAKAKYLAVRQHLLDTGQLENYYAEIQENPLYEEEAYMSPTLSSFPASKLNDQQEYIIFAKKDNQVRHYRLEWEVDRFTRSKTGKVTATLDPMGHWRIYDNGMPQFRQKFLDVLTVDDVYKNEAEYSDSKCAVMVYRQQTHKVPESDLPIATYLYRPVNKVLFYEEVAKATVFWGGKVLVENNDEACLNFLTKKRLHENIMWINGKRGIRNSEKTISDQESLALMFFSEDRHKRVYFSELLDCLRVNRASNSDLRSVFFLMMTALDVLKDEGIEINQEVEEPPKITLGNREMKRPSTGFTLGRIGKVKSA